MELQTVFFGVVAVSLTLVILSNGQSYSDFGSNSPRNSFHQPSPYNSPNTQSSDIRKLFPFNYLNSRRSGLNPHRNALPSSFDPQASIFDLLQQPDSDSYPQYPLVNPFAPNGARVDSRRSSPTTPLLRNSPTTAHPRVDSLMGPQYDIDSDLKDSSSGSDLPGASSTIQKPSNSQLGQHASSKPQTGSGTSHHAKKDPTDPLCGRRIVCIFNNKHYYRGNFTPSQIEADMCTHLNYEFAKLNEETYEMEMGIEELDQDLQFYQQVIDLKWDNPQLKVMLSLGGWSDSTEKYSQLARDAGKRKNFIEKAVSFLKEHQFDGMDLAWEYPNSWQGNIGVYPDDKNNFVTLLKELKSALEANNLLLSISAGAIKKQADAAYDFKAISDIVDYINLMTYDMHGAWESKTGIHVQFEALPGDKDPYCNVKGAVQIWIDGGADKTKLNVGVAFYGTTFTLEDPEKHGLGAPTSEIGEPGPESKEGGFLLYKEICKLLNDGTFKEDHDDKAGFYAYSKNQWVGYDSPQMIATKAKYVVNDGLGGVLVKDLSSDDYDKSCFEITFPLLRAVRKEMTDELARQE